MASFLTNLGRKHKISKRWLLGMPTSVKVEGLSTVRQLQTCICSETTPKDFQSLTLSFIRPAHKTDINFKQPYLRLQVDPSLQTCSNRFSIEIYIRIHKNRFSGVHFWAAGDISLESVGRVGAKRGDSIPVLTSLCQCAGFWSTNDPCCMPVCPHTPW